MKFTLARRLALLVPLATNSVAVNASAVERPMLESLLRRELLGPEQTLREAEARVERGTPRVPEVQAVADWELRAKRIRHDVLDHVVYRGEATQWRDAETRVEWFDAIEGGPGYHIRKLRYEALPGLWIPALLYEPETLAGKRPVVLNVNGHSPEGKAYIPKQLRSINLAKRGVLVLNPEWLGMGQLRTDGFAHTRMNQIDLCGTSGLAPFYLAMKRGLDVLLAHPNADPGRVGVAGLSGGGWQTIMISALDTRVTLANPVAGYSSFRTRARHHSDLGDSEQTPVDLAVYADYNHLTALLAPRAALLTYNAADDCCFQADHALPPLLEAARPIYRLFAKEHFLRAHVNTDPGNHNFDRDNREAFYRLIGAHFFAGNADFDPLEIASEAELKQAGDLAVEMPLENADFHTLALKLSANLPFDAELPLAKPAAEAWQAAARKRLRQVVRAGDFGIQAQQATVAQWNGEPWDGVQANFWRLRVGDTWTLPAVEFVPAAAQGTAVVIADDGRAAASAEVERMLAAGRRVLAVDVFAFGESRIAQRGWLFDLLLSTVGDRSLGVQSGQIAAIARWWQGEHASGPATLVALGPRTSLVALVAAGLEDKAIGDLELTGSLGSLKEIVERSATVDQAPEQFCFGLLAAFDIRQLAALAAPRRTTFRQANERVKEEMKELKAWYGLWGVEFDTAE